MHNKQQITGWLFLLLLCVAGCGQPVSKKQNTMINWTKLPDLPGAADTASLGVSAPFAGIHNGVLIVAGGCNFPDKPVTEGGAKRYYSEIFVLLPEGWKEIDRLPRPVAYGATVSTPEGIVCIGGNNSDSSLVEVSRISYNPTKGEVAVCALPSLPSPMDNLSAAFTGQEIYVAGGNENGQPCHTFLRLNLANIEKGWKQLPDFPGAARVQPVLATGESPNGTRIYLAGGFQPILNEEEPIVPTDVLVFDPATFTWQQETVLPPFKDGTNRTLTGGCAVTFQTDKILFMGGVNYDCFLAAIARPIHLAKAEAARDSAAITRLQAEAKAYMHHPVEWYRFNTTLLQYDLSTKAWSDLGEYEQLARAGAGAVIQDGRLTIINGELKPGIRTPQVNQAKL